MTTLPEEAVKAAAAEIRRAGDTYTEMAQAAITAALPFLPVQGAGVSADARQALDRFSFAAQQWGWQADQGSNDAIINDTKAEFDASYAALERMLSALEPSAARDLALEEVVETLEYVDRMFRIDLSKYIDWDGDGFNQAIFDTHQRVKKALRALSSPDHADAGKVEGDKNRETLWKSAARDFGAYLASNGTPYAIDYWNECFGPLFSAPASEGAE